MSSAAKKEKREAFWKPWFFCLHLFFLISLIWTSLPLCLYLIHAVGANCSSNAILTLCTRMNTNDGKIQNFKFKFRLHIISELAWWWTRMSDTMRLKKKSFSKFYEHYKKKNEKTNNDDNERKRRMIFCGCLFRLLDEIQCSRLSTKTYRASQANKTELTSLKVRNCKKKSLTLLEKNVHVLSKYKMQDDRILVIL